MAYTQRDYVCVGAFDVADLLIIRELTFCIPPACITGYGVCVEAEGISDTLTLRDKLNFMEGDMRTWVNFTARASRPPRKCLTAALSVMLKRRAGFDRAIAWAVSRNQMFYYMNVFSVVSSSGTCQSDL